MKITKIGQKIFEQIVRGSRKTNADIFFCQTVHFFGICQWQLSMAIVLSQFYFTIFRQPSVIKYESKATR